MFSPILELLSLSYAQAPFPAARLLKKATLHFRQVDELIKNFKNSVDLMEESVYCVN